MPEGSIFLATTTLPDILLVSKSNTGTASRTKLTFHKDHEWSTENFNPWSKTYAPMEISDEIFIFEENFLTTFTMSEQENHLLTFQPERCDRDKLNQNARVLQGLVRSNASWAILQDHAS